MGNVKRVHTRLSNWFARYVKSETGSDGIKGIILTLSSVIFQGIFYMDKGERIFTILLDIILGALIYPFMCISCSKTKSAMCSLTFAHITNGILNGQLPVVFKNVNRNKTPQGEFEKWIDIIRETASNEKSISAAVTYGSIVRGELGETSDLDVRIVSYPGLLNSLRASATVAKLRFLATQEFFPLDIFVLDDVSSLSSLDNEESPEILYDSVGLFNNE